MSLPLPKEEQNPALAVAQVHSAEAILLSWAFFLTSMTIQMIAQFISPILPLMRAWDKEINLDLCIGDDYWPSGL